MVRAVQIPHHRFAELKIHAQADGDVVAVLQPVRAVDGNVNAVARLQEERIRAVLILRLVDGGVVIHGPEALDFGFRQDLAIVAIEDVDHLLAADLQQEIALAVDVVRAEPVRRGDEDDNLAQLDLPLQLRIGVRQQLLHAIVEQLAVVGVEIGAANHDPGAGVLDAPDGFVHRPLARGRLIPPLAHALRADVEMHELRALLRRRPRQLDQARQREQRVRSKLVRHREPLLVQLLANFVGFEIDVAPLPVLRALRNCVWHGHAVVLRVASVEGGPAPANGATGLERPRPKVPSAILLICPPTLPLPRSLCRIPAFVSWRKSRWAWMASSSCTSANRTFPRRITSSAPRKRPWPMALPSTRRTPACPRCAAPWLGITRSSRASNSIPLARSSSPHPASRR